MHLTPKLHTKPLRFFLAVNRKDFKWIFFNILFYCFGSLSFLAANYFLGGSIDSLTLGTGKSVQVLLGLIVLFIVFYEIFYRLGHISEVVLISRMRKNTKKALFSHTLSLSFGHFADRFAGEMAHKVSTTADAFERVTVIVTNNFIENSVLVLISIIALGAIHIYYGIFLILWTALFVLGSYILAKEMNRRASAYAKEEARTTGAIVDTYGNIGTVKVYGSEKNVQKTMEQIDNEAKAYVRLGRWDILTFSYQGTSIILLTAGSIAITSLLYGKSLITLGSIVFVSTVTLRLFTIAWEMGKTVANFIRYKSEIAQNLEDLIVEPSVKDGEHSETSAKTATEVEFRNITFGYSDERPVLSDFSIFIRPKEKVGIVGLSGAGKTTFANLLLRFFDPQEGGILLNGKDIRSFTQEFLRSHISFISQDTSLFHTTVSENIAYGSAGASEEDIKEAARLAYAHEFITLLPKQYASIVGERGVKLSGGQRQRIAIARAILADRPLFLLDEATSALDSDSEGKIQKGLTALMEGKTVIAIAHRLSTLSHMDRIIFLENGKIAEEGTHAELLAQNGKYAALWQMQAGGFLPNE